MRRRLVVALALSTTALLSAGDDFRIVAVGDAGRRIMTPDGVAWTNDLHWSPDEGDLHDIAFGGGQFVAVGGNETRGRIVGTRDGVTWRELGETRGRLTVIASSGQRFVAAQGNQLIISKDGERFVLGAKIPWDGDVQPQHAAFGSGEGGPRFVFVGDRVDPMGEVQHWRATSEDGETLVSAQLHPDRVNAIASGSGQFVIVGPHGSLETSHDGQQWTRRRLANPEDLTRVVWDGQRFVIVGVTRAWSSADVTTWTEERGAIPGFLAWANHALGALGFGPQGAVFFSKDLREWNRIALPVGPRLRAAARGQIETK
jgi:hypothetical protein